MPDCTPSQPSLLFPPPLALLLMCSWQLWLKESRRFYPMCHWASSREISEIHRKTGPGG
uniref:AUP1 lipid droplet regulating VLDL assembly factor n=1 Tax=Myotis myotis TaxID=51298 RepID=A0A7J7U3V8_MYOMY|nr:AUP1 lipid droplet regulating VLDL assembly factor [Myotis myotis]